MLKVYIAGPLRAETEYLQQQNLRRARLEAENFWRMGFSVFCPHLNTAGMSGLLDNEDDFIEGDLQWLRCTDIAIFIPGWSGSKGAVLEHNEAINDDLGMEIYYAVDTQTNTLSEPYNTVTTWQNHYDEKYYYEPHFVELAKSKALTWRTDSWSEAVEQDKQLEPKITKGGDKPEEGLCSQ